MRAHVCACARPHTRARAQIPRGRAQSESGKPESPAKGCFADEQGFADGDQQELGRKAATLREKMIARL